MGVLERAMGTENDFGIGAVCSLTLHGIACIGEKICIQGYVRMWHIMEDGG